MANLNDGVGKKIVEALKKQSAIESGNFTENVNLTSNEEVVTNNLSNFENITQESFTETNLIDENELLDKSFTDFFSPEEPTVEAKPMNETFNDFMNHSPKTSEHADMPGNILILKKLIAQLPSGVTRHTGAQIIKQTMEALGISMRSVLNEAQEVQNNLQESSKECQMLIQEYKRKIASLEKQTQNYQKQYNALNELISLFIQTTK